jgi:hypothetical protein
MNTRRLGNTIRNFDGWFSQCTDNGLGIDPPNAMLLK